jgi:hypothetical protein
MTTGRINQVTTFRNHFRGHRLLAACSGHSPLSGCGVCQLFVRTRPTAARGRLPPHSGYKRPQTHGWHHLVSRSHTSRARSPLSRGETKVTALDEDYRRPTTPQRHAQTWRISEWLAASGLTIGKQSTSFIIARSHHIGMVRGFKGERRPLTSFTTTRPILFKSAFPQSRTL